jgi:hypothetical protein
VSIEITTNLEWGVNDNLFWNKEQFFTHYCAGDKIEKNEIGGACSAYGGGERRVQGFGEET